MVSNRVIRLDDERARNPFLCSFLVSQLHQQADTEGQRERVIRVRHDLLFDPLERPARRTVGFVSRPRDPVDFAR